MNATYYVVFGATLNGHIHEGSNNVGFQVYLAYQLCNGGCDWHQVLVYSVTGDQTFADVSKNFWGLQMGIQAWTTVTFRIGFYVYAWQNSIPWNTGYADFSGTNFIILQNFTVYQWQ